LKNALKVEPIDYLDSYLRVLVVGGSTFVGEISKSSKSFIFISLSPRMEPTSVFDYLILEFLSWSHFFFDVAKLLGVSQHVHM